MHYLPAWGSNLFQNIKAKKRAYEEKHGIGSSINISVWEPDGVPPMRLREILAKVGVQDDNALHNYWDNRSPERFCDLMIAHHTGVNVSEYPHLSTLAIPGIKPMLGLLIAACGPDTPSDLPNRGFIHTTPAYDLISYWSTKMNVSCASWPLYSAEDFKLNIDNIPKTDVPPRMILTVRPGNPTPVWATREDWETIITWCIHNKVRLVNDGAYAGLVHKKHVPLSQVAKDYPELEWIELFSVSKTMSACGWRVGAAVGSKDFIDELASVKGNTDSGANGPALMAIRDYLEEPTTKQELTWLQKLYLHRLGILENILLSAGLKSAGGTDGGFFSLWHCPKTLDGVQIHTAEEFNNQMIETYGIIGVPFSGAALADGTREQFIRYAVCAPLEDETFAQKVRTVFSQISITY